MTLVSALWDAEYRAQRYVDEPPVPFVDRIVAALRSHAGTAGARGLYVGCGNGRNFLPLVDAGLDLDGLDVSPEALRQLGARRPAIAARLRCRDFHDVVGRRDYAYLIAIQVVLERTDSGGITIRYDDGPKNGLAVHFYARAELDALTRDAFSPVEDVREETIPRVPPKTGSWSQWEGIWRRR